MTFSIRLSDEEKHLAESYAKLHSMSVGEAFKRALFEKIEDEYDITIADDAAYCCRLQRKPDHRPWGFRLTYNRSTLYRDPRHSLYPDACRAPEHDALRHYPV